MVNRTIFCSLNVFDDSITVFFILSFIHCLLKVFKKL